MNVYRNNCGELTCSTPELTTTVTDMVDAVLRFCQEQVDCSTCIQTCCAGLAVYADHVFLTRLLHLSRQTIGIQSLTELPIRVLSFDRAAGKWFLPQNGDGRCKFLSQGNKCMIYEARPLVCRLHVCGKIEPGFKALKFAIYSAYQEALLWEMGHRLQPEACLAKDGQLANPVSAIDTYDVPVAEILSWVKHLKT